MRGFLVLFVFALAAIEPSVAHPISEVAVYPIDRAQILSGQYFDFKVELPAGADPSSALVTINGKSTAQVLGQSLTPAIEDDLTGAKVPALWARHVKIAQPGHYLVAVQAGDMRRIIAWDVYGTGSKPIAKNVILLIGDGMTIANRTAARIMAKGMTQGRYNGRLVMDDLPHVAMLGTSSVDSIATDSANAASAFTTGHKSSVNALGVYADRSKGSFGQPKVELISEIAKRRRDMAIGIVTDAEVEDATPAAMIGHTRKRLEKAFIAQSALELLPDVLMGGGAAYFLPQSVAGSKRQDDMDVIQAFRSEHYAVATTAAEMKAAVHNPATKRLLGLYHPDNMNGSLDRLYLNTAAVRDYPDQPDLTEMATAALAILSKNKNGFVLMIEAGLIDKFSHVLDWERSVYDTIMLDRTLAIVKAFAEKNGDTLVILTPDHAHTMSLVGTIDDDKPGVDMREKIGAYAEAGFPNYPAADARGYPPEVNVSKRLYMAVGSHPEYYETFHPKLDAPFVPTVKVKDDSGKEMNVANPAYKDMPGAILVPSNLPRAITQDVHAVDDVILSAMGPGSDEFKGFMENTDVFRVMAKSLALGEK
jgi:alkaline phosphatase